MGSFSHFRGWYEFATNPPGPGDYDPQYTSTRKLPGLPMTHSSIPSVIAALVFAVAAAAQQDQKELFGLSKSWVVEITVPSESLAKMYPAGRATMGLSQRGRYKYVKADVKIGERSVKGIGLRFKGNSTFWGTSGTLKKSYKLDFDRFVQGQRFLGLKKLNLQNNATDPYQIREAVSYQVYRDAGVPACRVCFARVFLTVTGEFEREYLGNYTIVEQVDRAFLSRNYEGDKKGAIFKPEGKTNAYLGDKWNDDYAKIYIPKTKVRKKLAKPLIGVVKLLSQSDDDVLVAGIEKVLDVDEFLNYCAVTAFLANLDSPFMLAHNYYIAVPEENKRVVWIPWDLNLSMGGFSMGGRNQQNLSVFEATGMALFKRVIAEPRFRKIYEKHLWALVKGPGSPKTMMSFVELARKTTAKAIEEEANRSDVITKVQGGRASLFGSFGRRGGSGRAPQWQALERFVNSRAGQVRDQLEGKSKGQAAGGSMFGGLFGRGGAPRPRSAQDSLRDMIARSGVLKLKKDTQIDRAAFVSVARKLFAKIDKDQSGSLSRREVAAMLVSQRGQNASPSEARRIQREYDKDKNRKLSAPEWDGAYGAAFATWDADDDGKLTREELNGR